ncbi:probable 28S rRNA (cytosine-c(5))-methyltransferase [Phtheirospermum japonicum]|uniref:Probable 28S rRNA (Cytosine-c(5))-methyltransferase n=1 Tax=Phtheirospermum japonicum TaxID=374723 RepID=A0A830D329_9LAMI|nr:probable 28S rRNA (cytosine-c(5))-methyltransferase [Phtheirospermum japonicum]
MVARRKPIAAQRPPSRESKPEKKPTNPMVARRKPITAKRSPSKEPKPEKKPTSPRVARRKPITAQRSPAKEPKPEKKPSNAERSAYFARREAAKVLRSALQGDARRRAVGSIKTLVYSPSIRNKKATFALVCQTLKHLPVIKDVLAAANVPSAKWKKQMELMYIITYDILFGQEVSLMGDAEKYLMLKKDALQSALSRILKRKRAKNVGDLVDPEKNSESRKPRYVRVNTLKIDTEYAISELSQKYEVIDACSAPGNKTIHLASLMKGEGKIVACELDKERVKRLKYNVELSGLQVRAILLDPSCSGHSDHANVMRLQKLAAFQKKVLEHGLS